MMIAPPPITWSEWAESSPSAVTLPVFTPPPVIPLPASARKDPKAFCEAVRFTLRQEYSAGRPDFGEGLSISLPGGLTCRPDGSAKLFIPSAAPGPGQTGRARVTPGRGQPPVRATAAPGVRPGAAREARQ